MILVVPKGFPDPHGSVIPFRGTRWWVAVVWLGLVVPTEFSDPNGSVILFGVMVGSWDGWIWWSQRHFLTLMTP